MRNQMVWAIFLIGLFVGTNIGIIMGGLLFAAKVRDKVPKDGLELTPC